MADYYFLQKLSPEIDRAVSSAVSRIYRKKFCSDLCPVSLMISNVFIRPVRYMFVAALLLAVWLLTSSHFSRVSVTSLPPFV